MSYEYVLVFRYVGCWLPIGELEHARVHPKFLHSNATSHKWAFGGKLYLWLSRVYQVKVKCFPLYLLQGFIRATSNGVFCWLYFVL